MTIPERSIYPRSGDKETVYLRDVVTDPGISAGEYTIYNDFVRDPREFQHNNVLYHYPVNRDRLTIGKFCSIACGAKFLSNSANHTLSSLSTYPFPIFFEEWGWTWQTSPRRRTTGGTSRWETTCGSAMRR